MGSTPLLDVALRNNAKSAEALLTCGADINAVDDDGDTALLQSVFSHFDDVTKLLSSRGATYASWDSKENSLLHVAALSIGVRTINILLAAELKGIDPDAVKRTGKTAVEVAQKRPTKEEGLVHKFRELLADIRVRNSQLERSKGRSGGASDTVSGSTSSNVKGLSATNRWSPLTSVGPVSWILSWRKLQDPRSPSPRDSGQFPWESHLINWALAICLATFICCFFDLGLVWQILNPRDFERL
ncbi:hypothetical protein MMC25_005354 [Agyrium rufum]|nr:hypothetical protein [Agyrium rufum]